MQMDFVGENAACSRELRPARSVNTHTTARQSSSDELIAKTASAATESASARCAECRERPDVRQDLSAADQGRTEARSDEEASSVRRVVGKRSRPRSVGFPTNRSQSGLRATPLRRCNRDSFVGSHDAMASEEIDRQASHGTDNHDKTEPLRRSHHPPRLHRPSQPHRSNDRPVLGKPTQ